MKFSPLLLTAALLSAALPARAGIELSPSDPKSAKECKTCDITPGPCDGRTGFLPESPYTTLTIAGQFSDKMSGAYVDTLTGLWSSSDRLSFAFLESRQSYEDIGQYVSSTGLGFRQMIPGKEVIVGVNAFYDSISSFRGTDFDQLGLGAELLTHWFDARFNYYLPENKTYTVERFHSRIERDEAGGSSVRKRTSEQYESGLEGFETEAGVLIPGLERYAEVRVFAGYYRFENPFGSDYEGFKARLEARLLPGVIADVSYFDDKALMGGHWTAGVRASVPFSLLRLVHGGNPFEGFSDAFRPRSREFCERMSEMVIREHRVQTVVSDRETVRDRTTFNRTSNPGPGGTPGGGPADSIPFE